VGKDLFSLQKLEELWTRLFDQNAQKPFECVGEKCETLMALAKCKEQPLKNGKSLGVIAVIPDVKFDNSLLMISAPTNIPPPHRKKLDSVLTNS